MSSSPSSEKVKSKTNEISKFLLKISDLDIPQVYSTLNTAAEGLSLAEVHERIKHYGKNEIAREKPPAWYWMILENFKNPFVIVLLVLGFVSYLSHDIRASVVVAVMVVLSISMRFIQEFRSSRAAETLRKMVLTKAAVIRLSDETVDREGTSHKQDERISNEIPLEELVPGDIVYLSAGDMVPADVRLIESKDLFISQSALTGESGPVEKYHANQLLEKSSESPGGKISSRDSPLERNNLCFMGTSVVSGYGKAVVIKTGSSTYFGSLAKTITGHRSETSFDKGITKVTWILIRFIVVMVPIIFVLNLIVKGNLQESFLFAIAVAVGLTPEMLPMIVTGNLAKGAVAMSQFKVIVKRLNSIQSFGAMNILCTDKTGTLTQDKIILERYLNTRGDESDRVLEYGFLNSYYQSGLKNMLDKAILEHVQVAHHLNLSEDFQKVDEIPFDFQRKRMSVVVAKDIEKHLFICKGAVEELIGVCSKIEYDNKIENLNPNYVKNILDLSTELNQDGFRVIAIAYKDFPMSNKSYSIQDESDLVLLGLMAFLDPPKETSAEAIKILHQYHVKVKVLTGDNDIVTQKVCREVNLPVENILLGSAIEHMTDKELAKNVEHTTIFAKLSPLHKARIIKILKDKGHVVGFLGDGINDAPALRESDVGISADSATDIARESADIILLEKSLLVLGEGVIKGREIYGNIIKYIKMTASSNFGNVFSVMIASAFLPFLPMLPLQLLIQNLFYDFSQLSIPWDRMDKEFLKRPRKWEPRGIARFMVCMGPVSSIFDVTTFLLLWFLFGANSIEKQSLFQTGWFVEGLLSQTLIVHMIRTRKIPFLQSNASMPVVLTTLAIIIIGLYLPFSSLGAAISLVPLPADYFPWLMITLFSYCILAQVVKTWYIRKFRAWL